MHNFIVNGQEEATGCKKLSVSIEVYEKTTILLTFFNDLLKHLHLDFYGCNHQFFRLVNRDFKTDTSTDVNIWLKNPLF